MRGNCNMTVNIILPVFNEELRIRSGIHKLEEYLKKHPEIKYHVKIIDNASTDHTKEISKELCRNNRKIEYIRIEEKGIGIAFKTAVWENKDEIIGYMDIDMSTELSALSKMYTAFCEVEGLQMVNATRYSKDSILVGRKWFRNIISYILVALLKLVFNMKASDAICGFKFFRKEAIEKLLQESCEEPGWFLMIEVLLRAEKNGIKILELPVKWVYEEHTKVDIKTVSINYIKHIIRLKRRFKREAKNA